MKKFILSGALSLIFMGAIIAPVHAETTASTTDTTTSAMVEQIKALMAQLKSLQEQLSQLKGEIKTLRGDLREGMTDADIAKIQELLATDSSIYPEGKVTGYFGPLTKEALKRFQMRHGVTATGVMDEDTRDLLEEYLHEGFGDKIPPGLLRAPGIMKKVEDRFRIGCDSRGKGAGMGPLCKKFHANDEDDEDDEDEDNEDEDETDFDVEVEIEDGTTTVAFTFDGDAYEVEVTSTNLNDVLDAVADEIKDGDDASDLDEDLADAIETALRKAIADEKIITRIDARSAISDAENAIEEAQDAIDAATESTTEAEALLADAEDKLDAAQDKFDDRKYADAVELAEDAEELAEDAEDAL